MSLWRAALAAFLDCDPADTTDTTDTSVAKPIPGSGVQPAGVSSVSSVNGSETLQPTTAPSCDVPWLDWQRLPYGSERGRALGMARLAPSRCGCCAGSRWWQEAENPKGWRCALCHPPDGLAADAVSSRDRDC